MQRLASAPFWHVGIAALHVNGLRAYAPGGDGAAACNSR